ncbi:MAG: cupin domain-containing protein [Desulfamplus sp.]|nr:cupin domain-containing protein [Desulfamplus sp.]MBF0413621.1 cupin domain-containing protein [Desulfamplus sp.]
MNLGKVSQRIQSIMDKREISLEKLSELTGFEKSFLDTMLKEDIYPPLGPLMKIARALGVRLGTFLDDQASSDPFIVRKLDRESEISVLGGAGKSPALKFYSLGKGKIDRHMEPFFVEVMPESAIDKKLSSHEGEEFIMVMKGSIEIIYGTEKYLLNQGDSVYYNSVVPHYLSSVGDDKAELYAVIYIPE